jgi:hypothetical protein
VPMELHLFCHGEVQSLLLAVPFIGVGLYKIRNLVLGGIRRLTRKQPNHGGSDGS